MAILRAAAYDILGYGHMIADNDRTHAYARALRRVIRPDSVVIDLGTGVGLFAILAERYGAALVYAIEANGIINVAREIAIANHCSDRLEFVQCLSTKFVPRKLAHVIVSDLHGVLPLFQGHIPSIIDARERMLRDDGILIPRAATIWSAIIEAPECHDEPLARWTDRNIIVDLGPAKRLASNSVRKANFSPDQLLTAAQPWAHLDYHEVVETAISHEMHWTPVRPGIADGICLWFDTTLVDDIGFTNAPGRRNSLYGSLFFPFPQPVPLSASDLVSCMLAAQLVSGDYVWQWRSTVLPANSDSPTYEFSQSTFFSMPWSLDALRTKTADAQAPSQAPR